MGGFLPGRAVVECRCWSFSFCFLGTTSRDSSGPHTTAICRCLIDPYDAARIEANDDANTVSSTQLQVVGLLPLEYE